LNIKDQNPIPYPSSTDNMVRIIELEKRMELNRESSRLAIELVANDLKSRLASMNEFREAMKDQASNYVTRREMDLRFDHVDKAMQDKAAFWISIVSLLVAVTVGVLRVIR